MPTSFGISLIIFLLNRQHPDKLLFIAHTTVGEALSLPRSTGFQLLTRMGEFVPVYHICTIQPNTQLTNLAGGYEPPLQWRVRFLPAKQQFVGMRTKAGNRYYNPASSFSFSARSTCSQGRSATPKWPLAAVAE